jgi:molybdopterin converting factor small subunit
LSLLTRRRLLVLAATAATAGIVVYAVGPKVYVILPPRHTITLQVQYLQMTQAKGTETFMLDAPATYADLWAAVVRRHPALAPMKDTMEGVLDGNPATWSTPLKSGDVVAFLPNIAGG